MRMLRMLSNGFALRVEFPLVFFLLMRLRMVLDIGAGVKKGFACATPRY